MSAWTTHVTKYYRDRKRKDKNYSFKQAMKDAKGSYIKKEGSSETRSKKSRKRKTKRRRR
jgi:hypothetical protein